jgi:glycosyltransferase involved in cell wall biosynthesis
MTERPATVWIDTSFLAARWTGVAYYGVHLLNALAVTPTAHHLKVASGIRTDCLADRRDMFATMASSQMAPRAGSAQPKSVGQILNRWPVVKATARNVRAVGLAALWQRRRGIFHALNFAPPMHLDMPIIPLIHDMSCVVLPETHPVERVRYFQGQMKMFETAPAIHTVSHFSAGEITRLLGVPASRVHVIRPGPDPDAMAALLTEPNDETVATLERRFGLRPDGYVLGVGTLEPRKNLPFLVEAFLTLPLDMQQRFPLVLVGAAGWGNIVWPSGHEDAVAGGRIRHPGYVSRADLLVLYRHAQLSVYPSRYEGFGLPVVESLCLGTPVLVISGTACAEAGAGQAVALPASDVDAWRRAMLDHLSAPVTLAERQATRALMSLQPSWHDAARQTLGLYDIVSDVVA